MQIDASEVCSVQWLSPTPSAGVTPSVARAVLRLKDGCVYRGMVQTGEDNTIFGVHGRGEYERADGERFIGNFVNGLLEGLGQQVWPSGDVYEGMFVHGQKQGKGRLCRVDGITLCGTWQDDEIDGSALRIFWKGAIERCQYKRGVRDPWSAVLSVPRGKSATIIVIEPPDFYGHWTSAILCESTGLKEMELALMALQTLGPPQSLTPIQRRVKDMLCRGETLPRSLLTRFQKKVLDDYNGAGVLCEFPLNVEEARMLQDWDHKVTACIVVHADIKTTAERRWLLRHRSAKYDKVPSNLEDELDYAEIEAELAQYNEEVAPLIEYYKDVYVPIRAIHPVDEFVELLKRKFCHFSVDNE